MHNRIFGAFVLALFACATAKDTSSGGETAKAAAPKKDGCPDGYIMVLDQRGRACWKEGEGTPPAHCQPFRSPYSGYLLWDCPEEAKAADASACSPGYSSALPLTAEMKARLPAKLQICRKYADLPHHAAEAQVLEDLRASRGQEPLYAQCLDTFNELARLAPVAYSQPEIAACLDILWEAFGQRYTERYSSDNYSIVLLSIEACQYKIKVALQVETDDTAALYRYEELRPVHNSCLSAFALNENDFRFPPETKRCFCYQMEITLARRRSGN